MKKLGVFQISTERGLLDSYFSALSLWSLLFPRRFSPFLHGNRAEDLARLPLLTSIPKKTKQQRHQQRLQLKHCISFQALHQLSLMLKTILLGESKPNKYWEGKELRRISSMNLLERSLVVLKDIKTIVSQ